MPEVMELFVNETRYPVEADPEASLLVVLRDQLDLKGSKYGCGEGQYGAGIVLVDGPQRIEDIDFPMASSGKPWGADPASVSRSVLQRIFHFCFKSGL